MNNDFNFLQDLIKEYNEMVKKYLTLEEGSKEKLDLGYKLDRLEVEIRFIKKALAY